MSEKTLVALATYNERENLPALTTEILQTVPNADLLVIDDDSPDGTGDWAAEFAKAEPRFFLEKRGGKLGLGTAVLDAFRFAQKNGYIRLVHLDADFSHPPEKIPELLAESEQTGADVVIGSRYVRGGQIVGWPLSRKIMSRGVNGLARFLLGLKTKDNSGSFRCYRVAALDRLHFDRVRSRGYSFFEEILFHLKRSGATFREIPITFTDRVRGRSKVNRREAIRSLAVLFRLGLDRIIGR